MAIIKDNSIIAQLATPSMQIPIQYALTFPHHKESNVESLDFFKYKFLSFYEPDYETFEAIDLCKSAFKNNCCTALNASNEKAVELFFETVGNTFCLSDLEFLTLHLRDSEVSDFLMEKLLNYDGFIYIDSDFDLQNEIVIEYQTGRPLIIDCDFDNDGNQDFYAKCDFGAPEIVQFPGEKISVFYEEYPFVSKIIFHDDSNSRQSK